MDEQTTLVQQATSRPLATIQRDQAQCQRELAQVERELSSLADNLYQQLQQQLPTEQLAILNRIFNSQVMSLNHQHYQLDSQLLVQWLNAVWQSNTQSVQWSGLTLHLGSLESQYTQRSADELTQRIHELKHALIDYQQQIAAAQAIEQAKRKKETLASEVRHIERELVEFDELTTLQRNTEQRNQQQGQLRQELADIHYQIQHFAERNQQLQTAQNQLQQQLTQLHDKHTDISRQRNQRKDDAPLFLCLVDLPHLPWLANVAPSLENLSEHLTQYQNDCQWLLRLEEQIKTRLAELHVNGLTKFQHIEQIEREIEKIIEFAAHLPQEAQALERKARDAVINVTVCLRQLRDGLLTFKSKMKEFNSLISRRQISDLSKFKIEPQEEAALVEAINLLIATAEKVNTGDTFELFNHASLLDDEALNRAKNLLVGEGKAREYLRIEHLFRLTFILAKIDGQPESFEDIDSAASNGTVLMAKLVTGLALLHLMQDKRHEVRAVCYLDEASALDVRNQKILIDTAEEFGFSLIFASPTPLVTARYCVPISVAACI